MEREDSPLRITRDVFWTILVVFYEMLRALFRSFVPAERKDVTGEIVLITGTGHGMGREMALRFAGLGAKVICVDINASSNEDTYNMILADKGKAYKCVCDVTDRGAVMQMAERIRREIGDVDILVNNAGIMPCKPIGQQTEKEIRLMTDLNVHANLWLIQAFLPAMVERNHGHIVAMSSMAGLMGIKNLIPYCGSKYAVRGIMEALAIELRGDPRETNGINLTTIFPYMIDTGLCKKPRIRFQKLMQLIKPDEAADMIVDSVLRNVVETAIPSRLYYTNRYVYRLVPFPAAAALNDLFDAGVDAHE